MIKHLYKILLALFVISASTFLWLQHSASSIESNTKPLKIGMSLDNPPFEGQSSSGKPEGASVALAESLGDYLKRPIEIVNLPRKELRTALISQQIDLIISSHSIYKKSTEIKFSKPYANRSLVMLAHSEAKFSTFESLNSPETVIAVVKRTYASRWAVDQIPQAQIRLLTDTAAAAKEVADGSADVFISDPLTLIKAHETYPETTHLLLNPLPNTSGWGIATNAKNEILLPKINDFIDKAQSDGTFDNIRNVYLTEEMNYYKQYNLEYFF